MTDRVTVPVGDFFIVRLAGKICAVLLAGGADGGKIA